MKSLRSLYLFAALLVSGIASAQESDDLYFSVKDREQEMVAKRQSNAKLNAMTIRDNMQDQTMRSKFSNPDYQQNTNQSVARMPYFKKDYRRDYSFNSLYANNNATSNRWGVMNNSWFSPAMSMGMMWGNSMWGNSMWRNPYMMNSMMGNSMMWNDPFMMNSMAFGNPYSMMGMGFGNPYMMNPYMMNSMMWNDPFMMNNMMWGNPYSMMSPWGMNSGFGMGMGFGNPWGMGFGNPLMMRNSFITPVVYNSIASSVVNSSSINGNNSVTYPTSGSDYASYMRTSSDYGTFANSSVGNGTNYSAVEYKGGTANSYFYGTPADNGGSNWGTRSVDYNNGGSYNRNNNNSWGNNSSFGNGGSNSFGSNSSGYGSYGGGGGRSSGGRGGRGN